MEKRRLLYGFGDSLVEGHCIGIGMPSLGLFSPGGGYIIF